MSLVGEAFIRLRPDMSHFKEETHRGVSSSVKDAAKLFGAGFGVLEGVKFGKDIIEHAASMQKQVKAVTDEFGVASKGVHEFADKGGADLGISAHEAEKTAAKFGILFKNLGVGQGDAAKMTVGFEQLAGSIAMIRGADPAQFLQNLPLAAAGNLRSLKQLGIATDQNTLKLAAYKAGLIGSVKEGLTPATRAQAIYLIATAKLPDFLRQAAAASDDASNRQARLRAEWDNAKDTLGKGLLPAEAAAAQFLANNMPGAVNKTIKAFHTLRVDVHAVTKPLGGAKKAAEALLAALVIAKLVGFANAIRTNMIQGGTKILAKEFQVAEGEVVASFSGMELAAVGFSATLKAALISTGIGAIFVGLGIAAEIVITHWKTAKEWFATFFRYLKGAFNLAKAVIIESMKAAAYEIIKPYAVAIEKILGIATHLPGRFGRAARHAKEAVEAELKKIKPDGSHIIKAYHDIGKKSGQAFKTGVNEERDDKIFLRQNDPSPAIDASVAHMKAALGSVDKDIKKLGDGGVGQVKRDLADLNVQLADAIEQSAKNLTDAVESAKSNLGSIASGLSDQIDQYLDKPLQDVQDKLNRLNDRNALKTLAGSVVLPGGGKLSADPTKGLAQLKALEKHAGATTKGAIQDFIAQYQAATLTVKQDQLQVTKDTSRRHIDDLSSAFNRGKITFAQYKKGVLATLTTDKVSYAKAGHLLGSAFANSFKDQVHGLLTQAGVIATAPATRGRTTGSNVSIVRPLETLHQDQKEVARIQKEIGHKTLEEAKKQTALTDKTNKILAAHAALLKKINETQIGSLKTPKHGQAHESAALQGSRG